MKQTIDVTSEKYPSRRNKLKAAIICIATIMFMSGCDLLAAKYVDINEEAGIREIVSTSRTTTSDLLLLGIDSYPSQKKIKSYVLVPPPGFDGPEVLSRSVLPKGTVIHFTGARRCVNCYPKSVELSLKADGFAEEEPIYINMTWMNLLAAQ